MQAITQKDALLVAEAYRDRLKFRVLRISDAQVRPAQRLGQGHACEVALGVRALDRENTRVLAFENQFLFDFFAVVVELHTIVARLDILESVQHFPVFALHLVN